EEVERVLTKPLERLCQATITSPATLRSELETIRNRGWASSFEETNIGVWGVAVPILDEHDGVVAAVGVAGPSARLSPKRIADDVARLNAGANELARALGLRVPEARARRRGVGP